MIINITLPHYNVFYIFIIHNFCCTLNILSSITKTSINPD